ncbi:insulin receptor substrate 1 isoform X2 [Drosophila obscura]|nr:insulin receptor substrate 1 isoform X2 [Drosophila obscura]XP_022224192.1 insulin receptor substrate 1 isoform X2 [Drosophila obscura]
MASTSDDGLVLSGYQKKLKTMKKKFFVLYEKTNNSAARLEYYDTEKKFMQKAEPKRVIYLSSCFNINPRFDTKHRFVIVLSSREGGFGIVLESENDLRKWLEKLVFLQRHQSNTNGQMQSTYDHVWQVFIQKKGMSEKVGITGTYHCCLTAKSLTLVCIGPEKTTNGDNRISSIEILLTTIRRCGHASPQCIFYMELGRQSVLGCGELWMETDNAAVATNMHNIILSAMSAKTETNMNFLNVYQGRPDISHEPMRKRSSSANESSKPMNVIQNRQSAVELRNSSSLHNNTYGRERCDSLPTRNRTLSDCSNQLNLGSNHGFRSNTISGNRPHTTNKPNNSPPLNTPLRCSESEESSVSVDESDDNGSFTPYRRNTRSSKGVIPEENVDDFANAELSSTTVKNERVDNYIPMTPIKPISDTAHEILQSNHILLKSAGAEELNFNFPEHTSEKLIKDLDIDSDNQFDRPIRAYSIGNKVEHSKLKRIGYINDTGKNSHRVRAYSVGSKSKIPRCDLQRIVLVEKDKNKSGTNGSHNNIFIDDSILNEVIRSNTIREKKSTSAPLLSLKHQINTDRMSDLMEIDFSQTANWEKKQLIKNNDIPKNIENVFPKYIRNTTFRSDLNVTTDQNVFGRNQINNGLHGLSDGGYLEMKPVGKAYCESSVSSLPNKMEKLKLKDYSETHMQAFIDTRKTDEPSVIVEELQNSSLNEIGCKTMELTSSDSNENLGLIRQRTYMSQEIESNKKKKAEDGTIDPSYPVLDKKKLVHSISNEDYTQVTGNISHFAKYNDFGYKIIQIKSDSSLISLKNNQKAIPSDDSEPRPTENCIMLADNVPSSSTKCNLQLKIPDLKRNEASKISRFLPIKNLNIPSGHPSRISQPELYYASLDLPHYSGKNAGAFLKRGSCESPPVALSLEAGNAYAKIDFDQSD